MHYFPDCIASGLLTGFWLIDSQTNFNRFKNQGLYLLYEFGITIPFAQTIGRLQGIF